MQKQWQGQTKQMECKNTDYKLGPVLQNSTFDSDVRVVWMAGDSLGNHSNHDEERDHRHEANRGNKGITPSFFRAQKRM
jgi:kynureninase